VLEQVGILILLLVVALVILHLAGLV